MTHNTQTKSSQALDQALQLKMTQRAQATLDLVNLAQARQWAHSQVHDYLGQNDIANAQQAWLYQQAQAKKMKLQIDRVNHLDHDVVQLVRHQGL